MKATVEIDAGVCGFQTRVEATSEDSQNVSFQIETDCEKIDRLGQTLRAHGGIDAYQEIGLGAEGALLRTVRETLTGCCAGCAVPVGLFKVMQVAAGLALPKDISIAMSKD